MPKMRFKFLSSRKPFFLSFCSSIRVSCNIYKTKLNYFFIFLITIIVDVKKRKNKINVNNSNELASLYGHVSDVYHIHCYEHVYTQLWIRFPEIYINIHEINNYSMSRNRKVKLRMK